MSTNCFLDGHNEPCISKTTFYMPFPSCRSAYNTPKIANKYVYRLEKSAMKCKIDSNIGSKKVKPRHPNDPDNFCYAHNELNKCKNTSYVSFSGC